MIMRSKTQCKRLKIQTGGSNWLPSGWHINGGSWRCPTCGTIIGSNLLGDRPFMAVSQHVCKEEGE